MDLAWLQTEAKTIHATFEGMFYGLTTVLVLIAVVVDYFQLPIGGTPNFIQLIGRVFIAAFLLHAFPEITNTIADLTDALAAKVGNLHEMELVLGKLGERFHDLSWSWTSVRQVVLTAVSYLTFFLVYISVFLANAGVVYIWVLLYVFSPLLIAFFVLPSTAGATKALFRSLLEVSAWKIVWSTLASLLWSTARVDISKVGELTLMTLVVYNLLLAISVLLTPIIVSALFSKGLTAMTSSMLGMAAGAAALNPGQKIAAGERTLAVGGAKLAGKHLLMRPLKAAMASIKPAPGSTPPKWHSQIPPPNKPPPWLAAKLEREKSKRR